jgi:hypothetical protein
VHHDGDLVTVHLVGANSGSRRPYWWIGPDDPRPRAPALVALGLLDGATLCIDLSLSPDVITLHGPDLARKKLVRTLADQSWRAGLEVIVVGGVGGNTALLDVSRASSYAELAGRPRHRQEVIFGPPASAVELGAVRPTMSGDGARAVLIVVGASVRSRWSIDVASSAVRAASAVPQSDRGGSSPRLA